jgi:hypothetical protein
MVPIVLHELAYGFVIPLALVKDLDNLEHFVNENFSSLAIINAHQHEYVAVIRSSYTNLPANKISFISDLTSRNPSYHEAQDIINLSAFLELDVEAQWLLWVSTHSTL